MPTNNTLPESGFVRIWQILGNPKAKPPVPPLIPVSKSTWWLWVKTGRVSKPIKFGRKIAAWPVGEIRALMESFSNSDSK